MHQFERIVAALRNKQREDLDGMGLRGDEWRDDGRIKQSPEDLGVIVLDVYSYILRVTVSLKDLRYTF